METTRGRCLVGPDNGPCRSPGRHRGESGPQSRSRRRTSSIDAAESFRAPDTLCPATARLAAGTPIESLGDKLDPATLAVVTLAEPEIDPGRSAAKYRLQPVRQRAAERGAADLAAAGLDDAARLRVEAVSGAVEADRGSTYADFSAGEYGVLFDPRGWLTIVRGNPASALDGLGLALAAPVWLSGLDGAG